MKHKNKPRLLVERLEDRWVPTTIQFYDNYLLITNPTIGPNNVAAVTVTETGTGLQVSSNGSSPVVVGNVGNVLFVGSPGRNNFTFDTDGNSYNGNLIVSAGNGNDTIQIVNSGAAQGTIAGNVTLLSGDGSASVNIGANDAGPLSILGNVEVVHSIGAATLNVGNTAAPTTIAGDFMASGPFAAVTLSPGTQADIYSGNVTINDTLGAGTDTVAIGGAGSTVVVGGSLVVNGDLGSASMTLSLDGGTGLTVNGSTYLNLGNGSGNFQAADSVTFEGGFNLNAGEGDNSVTVSANTSFNSDAAVNLGDGDNNLTGLDSTFTALGNFSLTAGNGNNGEGNPTFNAYIGGNLLLTLGNGANGGNGAETITVAGAVGGTVYWRSGNGGDQLQLGNGGTNNYSVNAVFGNGNDTFAINTGTGIYDGYVDGGLGTNTLNYISGTPAPTYQQYNF
jgi:hypothetical protein